MTTKSPLPIDISNDVMDPVSIGSRYKLFQASSESTGNIFGYIQYQLIDGLRISVRSLDSRIKVSYEPDNSIHPVVLGSPAKLYFSFYETSRGPREAELGINLSKLYSTYNKKFGSAFQFGCSVGTRVHSVNRSLFSPFINPKFTFLSKYGWTHLNVPINKKSNRIVLKHHMFFSLLGNTMLSSLEISTRLFSKAPKNLFEKFIQKNNLTSSSASLLNPYESSVIDTVHYKIVHVGSSTEFGIRRLNNIYGITKYQLEFGLKHSFTPYVGLQCLYTYTIGEKANFGLTFGLSK